MPTLSVPPEKSPDRRGVESIILGVAGAVPWVGGLLSAGVQQGLAIGQEKLLRQFLTELAVAQDRFLMRLSDVELDAFLARREAAAAINQATQIALKTPSREKHQLLGRAVLNAATTDSEDGLIPFFWTLVEKHSALEVRLLSALDDPINRAIDCGAWDYIHSAAGGDGPVLAECLFAVVPELRHPYLRLDDEYASGLGGDDEDSQVADEDDEELDDEDVSGSPEPGWLFEHLVRRLDADGLLDTDRGSSSDDVAVMLVQDSEEILGTRLTLDGRTGLSRPGHFPDKLYCCSSHLGARYLAFLQDEPY